VAIAAAAAVVVVVVAGTAITVTALNSGGAGTPVAGRSSASSGPAASPAARPVTSSATIPASTTSGGSVPSAYLGKWHGTLADNTGLQGPQTTDLTLTGGAGGAVVGAVSYSDVGCQYQLRLVSTSAAAIELYEEIQSGACYSEYVVLTASGNGMTESVYPTAVTTGQPSFSGVLTKGT
jgi:hypothetical protein